MNFIDINQSILRIIILIIITACAPQELLIQLPAKSENPVDFSGEWVLRGTDRNNRKALNKAISETNGVHDHDVFLGRTSGSGSVYVFLESGKNLKITQTIHGLFISFDRAVVEEYRFGEKRIISVGQVEAQRVSGWVGSELVIETLDKHGMKMTEIYKLLSDVERIRR